LERVTAAPKDANREPVRSSGAYFAALSASRLSGGSFFKGGRQDAI
jgi:hypothetical protein